MACQRRVHDSMRTRERGSVSRLIYLVPFRWFLSVRKVWKLLVGLAGILERAEQRDLSWKLRMNRYTKMLKGVFENKRPGAELRSV